MKLVEHLKTALSKDPNLANMDKGQIIEKMKSEGVLGHMLDNIQIPNKRSTNQSNPFATRGADVSQSDSFPGGGRTSQPSRASRLKQFDPNKRHIQCQIVNGRAFVDFVNPRDDEYVSLSISFMRNRYHTKKVRAGCELEFNETFILEFEGQSGNVKFDASKMIQLNVPIHLTILRHRKNEKPVVLGTKNLDWRHVLFSNSIQMTAEFKPVDLTHKGALGILYINLDLYPSMMKSELCGQEQVEKQLELERKYDSDILQEFLEYANAWWSEFKDIRPSHKSRLVKIFAETDDREASVYKPTCSLI